MIGAAMGLAAPRRDPVPVDVRGVPDARLRLHPHGGDQQPEHQDGRVARRRVDWRGRPVADGARGSGDDARAAEHRRALSRATPSAPNGWSSAWPITRARRTCARRVRRRRSSTAPTRRSRSAASRCCARATTDVATVIGAGVTVFEALKAYDELKTAGRQHPRHRPVFTAADRRGDAGALRARDEGAR